MRTLVLALLASFAPVSIAIGPAVVFDGKQIAVQCHVPLHEDNRWLVLGLDDGTSESVVMLNGGRGDAVFYERIYTATCGVTLAYCRLTRAGAREQVYVSQANVGVAGCDAGKSRKRR